MNICIAGWYFHRPLLTAIAQSSYPAFIVKNREGETCGIPWMLSPENRGLEFGCYQRYLMGRWDGTSDVLFIQDDGEIVGRALREIAELAHNPEIDQAFIFRDEYEEFMNAGHSGRAFWCRASFLDELKRSGGFAVDWANVGDTTGKQANYGVFKFAERMQGNRRGNWIAIVPGIHMGRRGGLSHQPWQYRRDGFEGMMMAPELTR